ncbi:MFS transporter [Staphylococcus gallinarum]|uniref:Putative proline/betaine transporter n=1 Tax=Staphylococcus gallinarum TaxID=1293 RepID=A0A2T4SVY0_STAGA|nr:MFS transporter [Staphylococcus gallinarum]MCD8821764.1 MFS transporter [Staphylococcus gallinarum]MCD8827276.1 MFS transporter [Staphylococcus gallinarum]MCD8871877.1 MFS transporter [Staphylococcus gallinarum]MCQ9288976.1 MFS transporter [Staphylococcus gallinarum]MCW0984169.1 MFS transporter [Staphylococcus gallinarum]
MDYDKDFDKSNINKVDPKAAKKTVFATGVGNAMEWFDFGLYSYLAVIIGQNFFSSVENDQLKTIFTFATFAIAFLLRPVGGIIFGIIGDKYGRKVVLTTTIIMMAFSTLLIGLLPTYDQIGVWAPILLLFGRVLQGFSTGGEYAGAMVYVAESSPDNKRNTLGCGLEIGTLSGYIAASVLSGLLFFFLDDQQMASWGWRIPFILGLFLGIFGFYLRRRLEESPVYENDVATQPKRDNIRFFTILRYYYKDILVCFVAVAFFNCTNYMVTSYMPSYLQEIIKLDSTTVSFLITIVMAIMIPLALMFGRVADKIGEKKVFLIGLIGTALFSVVSFSFFQSKSLVLIIIGIFILGFFLSTYEATMPGSLPTMFYTHIRYRTLAVTFNVSVSLFGGTTPLIASSLVAKTGDPLSPAYYLAAISVVGIIVISLLHVSTAGKSLKGSYPNVQNDKEYEYYANNPEKALWWAKDKRV